MGVKRQSRRGRRGCGGRGRRRRCAIEGCRTCGCQCCTCCGRRSRRRGRCRVHACCCSCVDGAVWTTKRVSADATVPTSKISIAVTHKRGAVGLETRPMATACCLAATRLDVASSASPTRFTEAVTGELWTKGRCCRICGHVAGGSSRWDKRRVHTAKPMPRARIWANNVCRAVVTCFTKCAQPAGRPRKSGFTGTHGLIAISHTGSTSAAVIGA